MANKGHVNHAAKSTTVSYIPTCNILCYQKLILEYNEHLDFYADILGKGVHDTVP
jgi:hypothetical protein